MKCLLSLTLLAVPAFLGLAVLAPGHDREDHERHGSDRPDGGGVTIAAPEIDPTTMTGPLSLLGLGTLILTDRRRPCAARVERSGKRPAQGWAHPSRERRMNRTDDCHGPDPDLMFLATAVTSYFAAKAIAGETSDEHRRRQFALLERQLFETCRAIIARGTGESLEAMPRWPGEGA